jgi:hypothetical protein
MRIRGSSCPTKYPAAPLQLPTELYRGCPTSYSQLIEIGVDAAWEAADRYGPGWAWRELADQGAKARPGEAADTCRPRLESDLRYPDTKLYSHIAVTLATMSILYEHGGRADEFASLIVQIRRDYGRRASLMKALNAKGL